MTPGGTDLVLQGRVDDARSRYAFETADGVCSPDSFRPAELLLVEECWDREPGDLLVPEANYGVVGTVLAGVADAVVMTESSARASALCRANAARNDADASVSLLAECAELEGRFDTVAYAPKPYTPLSVGCQRIADALSVIRPGGRCYVAAAPTTGLSRYEDCLAEATGDASTVAEHGDVELVVGQRPDAYDPPEYVTPRTLRPTVDGVDLELVSVPGCFAAGELDHGTRLLAETARVPDGARVLDCCCGYGALGTYAARVADCEVWLTDDDSVATRCAECSLEHSGVEGTVVTADGTEAVADRRFDLVLTNPPTHAGSRVLDELFAGIEGVLAPDGECLLVHHSELDLSGHLRGFADVETVRTGTEHAIVRARP